MKNNMKKILRALDNKDLSYLTTMIAHDCLDPNKLIPDKGVSFFHLIIGHQSETFAFKVAKLFLRYGGDPNVASEDGVTPIHVAASWGRTRILHLLLVNGGDPWLQDDDKKNAFNYAFEEQEWDAVEMLHHFQQMHSSASSKKDVEPTPTFEMNFQRILLRKGGEMYEYALASDKTMKSIKTQTQAGNMEKSKSNNSTSPVLNKIKYFESKPSNSESDWIRPEKSPFSLLKEHYQTSCELLVNTDDNESNDEVSGTEEARSFLSSIHIDTTGLKTQELSPKNSLAVMNKSSANSLQKSTENIRSQLFMELQEAVLRRSKLRLNEKNDDKGEMKTVETKDSQPPVIDLTNSPQSMICLPSEVENGSVIIEDPFVAKEVSYLYGVNLSNNSLLKHMSDFASKVMKEIELSEAENYSEKVNERSSSNALMTSAYITCDEESDVRDDSGKIVSGGGDIQNNSFMDNSNDSFVSVTEEYKYTDKEEGIVLLEKKFTMPPTVSEIVEPEIEIMSDGSSIVSDISSVPSAISYASDTLRTELTTLGYNPGPIDKTTKKLYLRKLWRLKKAEKRLSSVKKAYSSELQKTLDNTCLFGKIVSYNKFEEEMTRTFDENPKRKWREGGSRTSFNYLLLDPRISANLPRRAMRMSDLDIWHCFLSSVFYVGKGKRARPYAHLYEAASSWNRKSNVTMCNEKIRYILDIWSEDLGVICLHVFQNIIPVEAFTREAAMIDALRLPNLKNIKCGEYYGSAATWTSKDKVKLGVYLLYKAMLIFLNEGERQIRPFDIS